MEIISGLNQKKRYFFDVKVYPYLLDHHLEDKVILPAVESLIILASAVKTNYSQMELNCLRKAVFSRFLTIVPDTNCQPVIVDLKNAEDGGIRASLLTSIKSKTGNISREINHASVEFLAEDSNELTVPHFRAVNKLKGDCISIPSATIYRELIAFGISYQNIIGDLSVSSQGVLAYVSGGNYEADEDLLGSPFPLDALMHAACVWGKRFAGIVSFPVGFEKRIVYQKTKKREEYLVRVVPSSINKDSLIFDAWIYDKDDVMCESVSGIKMMDVTRGRMRPPEWIKVDL